MRIISTLTACLLLGACNSAPPTDNRPIARSNLQAIHNAQIIPLPVNANPLATPWPLGSNPPRMAFGTSISNYRIFSLRLKKGEHYNINIKAPSSKSTQGINKYSLKPRALLMDTYGAVLTGKPSVTNTTTETVNLGLYGEAPEDGVYYLLVAFDDQPGKTIAVDNLWLNNSPLMSIQLDTNSAPTALKP